MSKISRSILVEKLRDIVCEEHINIKFELFDTRFMLDAETLDLGMGKTSKIKSFNFQLFTLKNIERIINYITTTINISYASIIFVHSIMNKDSIHEVCSVISEYRTICKITLVNVEFDDGSDVLFVDAMNKNSGIQGIDFCFSYLSNYDNISRENIKNISSSVNDYNYGKIIHYLSNNMHLETLRLVNARSDECCSMEPILDIISKNLSIKSLNLSSFKLCGNTVEKIMTIINENATITSLHLRCTFWIDEINWQNVIDVLKKNHQNSLKQ